jgi:hypothetical protein
MQCVRHIRIANKVRTIAVINQTLFDARLIWSIEKFTTLLRVVPYLLADCLHFALHRDEFVTAIIDGD